MKLLYVGALAALVSLPTMAISQSRKHVAPPERWMTSESLASALGLSEEQSAGTSDSYAAINQVLADATSKREQHKAKFHGRKKVIDMSENERKDVTTELRAIRAEYDERQADLDARLSTFRSLLTAEQQTRFDALAKPRLVPEGARPVEYVPKPRGEPTRIPKPKTGT